MWGWRVALNSSNYNPEFLFQSKPIYTSRPAVTHRSPRKSTVGGSHAQYPGPPLRPHRPIPAPTPYLPSYAMPYREYAIPLPSYPRMPYPPPPQPVSIPPGMPYHWPATSQHSRVIACYLFKVLHIKFIVICFLSF